MLETTLAYTNEMISEAAFCRWQQGPTGAEGTSPYNVCVTKNLILLFYFKSQIIQIVKCQAVRFKTILNLNAL